MWKLKQLDMGTILKNSSSIKVSHSGGWMSTKYTYKSRFLNGVNRANYLICGHFHYMHGNGLSLDQLWVNPSIWSLLFVWCPYIVFLC